MVPQLAVSRTSFTEDRFSTDQGWGDGVGMTHSHCIYCALYFYYYISSSSDHRLLDPRGWGPLLQGTGVDESQVPPICTMPWGGTVVLLTRALRERSCVPVGAPDMGTARLWVSVIGGYSGHVWM